MVAFKLLLSLALVSVALGAKFPRATVQLSGEGLDTGEYNSNSLENRVGEPIEMTCSFDPTLPEADPQNMNMPWTAEVSFGRIDTYGKLAVFGTFKSKLQDEI